MPLAYYPAYRQTAADPGVAAYWKSWMALPFWPCGPQWFLWELLTFNIVAMLLHRLAPNWCGALGRLAGHARGSPLRFFMALAAVSAVVYVPLALIFLPWEWTHTGLLSFQLSRPLHYLVYFLAGFAIGTDGLERSVLAVEGPLARQWAGWLGAGLLGFGLWALPTSFTLEAGAPIIFHIAAAFGYAIACASGSFALLALCLRFATVRRWTLDSLSANAYGMYLLHYVFVVWLQFALLNVALFAVAKATIAFAVTLGMSWVLSAASSGVSFGSRLAGAKR
jgi:surface polysaccharide O-acyltransferase-like enzyme